MGKEGRRKVFRPVSAPGSVQGAWGPRCLRTVHESSDMRLPLAVCKARRT